ncbi:Rdx family-domain-containing protein [Triangularia verruculosa]|uniref:Rdx family-domain-containing protein n=1 Tax=Triangularia verruculosa TaxID=2587418 RepID=A0AAN6XLN8_9PEZI|nr:Rdx family-domain-containing protein [Triangularia verruculosa]
MAEQRQQQQQGVPVAESTGGGGGGKNINADEKTARLPRVTIQFCTQCKWMLRAAYFAQELLSTFSTSLGEVALQPATGGVFIVEIITTSGSDQATLSKKVLWDRKTDGGFPETKELKRRVRDIIDPGRGLGHVDRDYPKPKPEEEGEKIAADEVKRDVEAGKACTIEGKEKCEDCQ